MVVLVVGIAKRFAKEKRRSKSKGKVRNGYSFSNAKSCEKQQLGSGQQQHNNRKKKRKKRQKIPNTNADPRTPNAQGSNLVNMHNMFPLLDPPPSLLHLLPLCLPCPFLFATRRVLPFAASYPPFPPSISSPRRDRRASRRFLPLSSRAGMCIASRVASDRLPWSAQCEE